MEHYFVIGFDLVIIVALLAVAVVDAKSLFIPDSLTLVIAGSAFAKLVFFEGDNIIDSVLGAIIGFILFEGTRRIMTLRLKRDAMGFGDVKLIAAGGLWVGIGLLPLAVLIACASAFIVFLVLSGFSSLTLRDREIPFGPFIAIGLITAKYVATCVS